MKTTNYSKSLIVIFLLVTTFNMYSQNITASIGAISDQNMPQEYKKIVLMGNSITESWQHIRPAFFKENPNLICKGISRQTTDQMLARFQRDVIQLQPQVVVILAGINDIAENNGPIALSDIMANIEKMAQLALNQDIKVMLCTLVPANRFTWRPNIDPSDKVIALNSLITKYAYENRITLVNYYDRMVDDNKGLKAELGPDGVHPNAEGYAIMEKILLESIIDLSNKNP
uniref:GDSL-type esterase/lipase family protein n=1 Tax=Fulvivirga sp. TaxID=1931237 RepID=UPI004049B023